MNTQASSGPISSRLQVLTNNWVLILFILSIVGSIIGKVVYGIAFFQPLEEIASKQQEYRRQAQQLDYQRRIVNRHIDLGNEFLNVLQLGAAKHEFKKALELDRNNIDAHFGRMKAEIFDPIIADEYDPEIVKKRLNSILKERPADPHALAMLGNVYRSISREISMQYYEKAIAADPKVASAYAGLALLFDQERMSEKREENITIAIDYYEQARALSEWNQTYLNNLGYQYLLQKNYQGAINNYRLLLDLDFRYLLTYYTLSNAYRLDGDFFRADWYQKRLIELFDNTEIIELRRNTAEWFFHTDDRTIYFYDYPMKKAYALYNTALTTFLYRGEEEAKDLIEQAKAENSNEEPLVIHLLRYDIKMLRDAQAASIDKLDDFEQRFLQ